MDRTSSLDAVAFSAVCLNPDQTRAIGVLGRSTRKRETAQGKPAENNKPAAIPAAQYHLECR
ncbi:hypothetical protein ACYOEI_04420 [Singulisphaera rosea]